MPFTPVPFNLPYGIGGAVRSGIRAEAPRLVPIGVAALKATLKELGEIALEGTFAKYGIPSPIFLIHLNFARSRRTGVGPGNLPSTNSAKGLSYSGDLEPKEIRQAQLFDRLTGGGGYIHAPKSNPAVEGVFRTGRGDKVAVSFKDFSETSVKKLFNMKTRIKKNIRDVQADIAAGRIQDPVELVISARQVDGHQLLAMLDTGSKSDPKTLLQYLKESPFRQVIFETNDGIRALNTSTGEITIIEQFF